MDYFTIASTGNATDFGNLGTAVSDRYGTSNETRGVAAGGFASPADAMSNAIDYFTIASASDSTDFGDLAAAIQLMGWSASNTRGVSAGGGTSPSSGNEVNTLQSIEFATTSNTTDFGDLTAATEGLAGASNSKRGITLGGKRHPSAQINVMEYYSISSPGNSADFGDLTVARTIAMNGSNSPGHGGLEDELPQRPSVNYMPGSGRALFAGGMIGDDTINRCEMIHIPTLGNGVDFADISTYSQRAAYSSTTRFFSMGMRIIGGDRQAKKDLQVRAPNCISILE